VTFLTKFILYLIKKLNSTENETQKRRYTRKIQLTSVKEGIIPFSLYLLSSETNLMNFSFSEKERKKFSVGSKSRKYEGKIHLFLLFEPICDRFRTTHSIGERPSTTFSNFLRHSVYWSRKYPFGIFDLNCSSGTLVLTSSSLLLPSKPPVQADGSQDPSAENI
jgi:hypothetical protein